MQGFLDFDESFDSCITVTLTLFLSNTTSSVSLLPIPLALNCRTLNVLSSLICSADGAGVGDGEGGGGVGWPSRGRRSNLYLSDTVLHLRVRNILYAPIQYIWCTGSLILDWSRLGHILGGSPWI